MIVILRGANSVALRRRLQQLKDETDGGSGMLDANYASIDGKDAKPFDILAPAMTPPFLAPRRLVVVDGFLDRFETRGEPRASGARPIDAFEDVFKTIDSGLPPTTTVVFTGSEARATNPAVARLKQLRGATDEEYGEMRGPELLRYINEEAASRGITFRTGPSREAHIANEEWERARGSGEATQSNPAALIAALTNGDTSAIANELDKLALYTLGRAATVDDIYEACAGERDVTTFAFADALMDGKLGQALQTLGRVLRDSGNSQPLLGLLVTRYQTLGEVVDLLARNAPQEDVVKALGNAGKYPGLRDAALARARRHGEAGVRGAFEAIVEFDRRHKLGEVDEEVGLDILVTKLCRVATARPSR
ncbi:MAG: DNA polymerase III subunit delta [Dehalococcoidia bacterium]